MSAWRGVVPSPTRMTRVTALDADSGESETIEIGPGEYVVICGGDRYVSHDQASAATNVVTIKTHQGDFR